MPRKKKNEPQAEESICRAQSGSSQQSSNIPQEQVIRGAEGETRPPSQQYPQRPQQSERQPPQQYQQKLQQEQQYQQRPQQAERPPTQQHQQRSQQEQQPPQQYQQRTQQAERPFSQQYQQQSQQEQQPPQQYQQRTQQAERPFSQQYQQQSQQERQPPQQYQQRTQQAERPPPQQYQQRSQQERQPPQQYQQRTQQAERPPSQQYQQQSQKEWQPPQQYQQRSQREQQFQQRPQQAERPPPQQRTQAERPPSQQYPERPLYDQPPSQQPQRQPSQRQQQRQPTEATSQPPQQIQPQSQDKGVWGKKQSQVADQREIHSQQYQEPTASSQITRGDARIPRGAESGYSPMSEESSKGFPPSRESQQITSLTSEIQSMAISTPKDKSAFVPEATEVSSLQPVAKTSPKKTYTPITLDIKISPTLQQKFLPSRPDDGGKKGRPIKLIINCCDVKINPMKIFMYDIEMTKAEVVVSEKDKTEKRKTRDVTPKMKKKDVLRIIIKELLQKAEGLPVFDGGRIIFTNKLLPYNEGSCKITHTFNYECENVTCHFTIQRVKEEDIELGNLNNYIQSKKGRSDDMPQEALRALDTIFREMFLNKNLITIGGRAIFDPKTSTQLRCGPYILMEGYATTIRPHMWKVRFNFDKTQVVCHEPINLYDYISKILDPSRINVNTIRMLTKKLKTLRVQANHLKNTDGKPYSRKYTIFGFSSKSAREEKIVEKNLTIEQYFQKEYNIRLKYPNLVMIKTSPSKPTFVPIELLTMLPNQRVVESDPKIVQEVIRSAAIPAADRLHKLNSAITNLQIGNRGDKFLKNYMIEIDPRLINVDARVLDGPEGIFGGQRTELLRGGKWDIRNKKFLKPYDKEVNWALFGVGTNRDYQRNENTLYDIEEKLPVAARNVGINMKSMYQFVYVPYQNIEKIATEIIKDSEKEKKKLDLLVFVVINDEDYKEVKKFGDVLFGIVTQCMKYATLTRQKFLDQYLGNIMLKVNGKLGGINWELSPIRNKLFTPIKDSFMVFGIDVTHPASNRNDLSKSVAAMVGSLDHNATLYSALIRQQISKKERAIIEIVVEMEDMVYNLLLTFYKANKQLKPRRLIFYRDGVSEGQFEIVFKHEIIAIQNACQKLDKNYQPPITYIVVQKRHKIRFFPQNQQDGIGRSGNVPSGTVVDKDITHCREFDFYLCSHEGIQGTSKPAHYHVLFDENNWGSDELQSFTYFLCHIYARCTRSVSYPAPTYYAHLAAFRGRTLIGLTDDDSSSTTSGHSTRTEMTDSQILINEFHHDKLFFI